MKIFLLLAVIACGCGSSHKETHEEKIERQAKEWASKQEAFDNTDPYDIIMTTFSGRAMKSDVQPMLEAVMKDYRFTIDRENIIKVANMLLSLRQSSKVGVTEMDILKHIYQKGNRRIALDMQAGLSSDWLEKNK